MKQGVRRGSGGVAGWALLALLTGCGGEDSTGPAGMSPPCPGVLMEGHRVLALVPASDAYVWEAEGGTVHGRERKLVADNLSRRSAFLRFEVPALPGPVLNARLHLYALDGSTDGPKLFEATAEWSEDEPTWARLPTLVGEPLGDAGDVPHGSWVEYDVGRTVKGLGTYGFALVTESRNGVDFASKDHAREELTPLLVLTVDTPAGSECGPAR
ncbi:MAG TPA: DNRLRE domain-containing protein [Myxococcaceae bacterium]|nr:DNRLRE domain-containing protein [Myxococcaceae bacterium]